MLSPHRHYWALPVVEANHVICGYINNGKYTVHT